jgi:tetratricopeptide (TPR) repeat protein
MGIDFQLHRASVDIAKGFRQFQKADSALSKDNIDSTVRHLNKGLEYFARAQDHVEKAEDEAYSKAGAEIDKGNKELKKSIDAYADGNTDRALSQYENAMDNYDKALELID